MKNILIKILIALSVLLLIHSVFWFFKTGQVEKNINNFIAENAANISIGNIEISGYPFSQKITIRELKFLIPNPALSGNRVIVREIQISSGIFDNHFKAEIEGDVMLQTVSNETNRVEFNSKPEISFAISSGKISEFSYKDNGYRVFDNNKNIVYGASSSTILVKSNISQNGQIISKINVSINDIENFGLINIYKNTFERKIIDGIKTGDITIGNSAMNDQFAIASSTLPNIIPQNTDNVTTQEAADVAGKINEAIKINNNAESSTQETNANAPTMTSNSDATKNTISTEATVDQTSDSTNLNDKIADNQSEIDSLLKEESINVKSNFSAEIEYILTPNNNEQQIKMPIDPSQMQIAATQYSRSFKINSFEFSNQFYKLSLNGQIDYFQDDAMPSGFTSIKIENASKMVKYFEENFAKITNEVQANNVTDLSPNLDNTAQNAYKDFLNKITNNLQNVVSEISAKNQLSQGDNLVFDLRREKNLEFVINETPLREVLGKF